MDTLFTIAFILVIAWFAYNRFRPLRGLQVLSSEQFQQGLEQTPSPVLIDVREKSEFNREHIPGARNIPLFQVQRNLPDIPKDRPVYLYCKSGMRSRSAAGMLLKGGVTNIAHLRGGLTAWKGKLTK